MLETTPGFKPKVNLDGLGKNATDADLMPVIIYPSQRLWRIELALYGGLLFAAFIALFPFFLTSFYWPCLWLLFCMLIFSVLRKAYRAKNSSLITLSVPKNVWRLRVEASEVTVIPFAEILLWAGVIVLPVVETSTDKKHHIVVLPDSVSPEDWHRLRVWLRTCFRATD